jgi:hypothetical protein
MGGSGFRRGLLALVLYWLRCSRNGMEWDGEVSGGLGWAGLGWVSGRIVDGMEGVWKARDKWDDGVISR